MAEPEAPASETGRRRHPSDQELTSRFRFQRFGVIRVSFQEVGKVNTPDGEDKPKRANPPKIIFGMQISTFGEESAEVRMTVEVTPDPRFKPYEILVEVGGLFSVISGTSDELAQFCMRIAPSIMFPYVRQLIHTVTADGRYGRVVVPLLNLQSIIKPEGWEQEGVLPDKP